METRAAVARGAGQPFSIETLQVEGPGGGEVLVEIAGVGLCHTDLVFRDQFIPYPVPAVLGHEGAGIVRAVGEGVEGLEAGDTVVLSFGSCGTCPQCRNDKPSYCRDFAPLNYSGARTDGSTAYRDANGPVASHFFLQSSFAQFAVAAARTVVKVDAADIDLRILGTLGCGFQTGAGSILRSFDCPPGSSLAIFGAGPVGLAAVMAAKDRGCDPIVVVEPDAARRQMACELGASEVVDLRGADTPAALRQSLPHGFDYVLETSGRDEAMSAGLDALASHGTLGLVGVPQRAETALPVNVAAMITYGRRIVGIVEGDSDPATFIPELIAMYRDGRFPFDRLVTTYPFDAINEAVQDQAAGRCIKAVMCP
ncbi:NAD(P)-dependent alcohol dehydrogenase [Croceicoccus bisphenolivorans]|uniref:NAD(P)-dependent alcohol dehydrogenase n=1 Tax=Croceicoccus bisphenolivorans TaxID=1783232 RepID=UPI0008337299|nr:NAD(P)-dependent alcohol dehydrogenase [Croceicoccus bisphenolivorans]